MRDGIVNSIATRLSSLRSFFDFLVLRGEITTKPCKRVSAPRKQRRCKNLDVDEVGQLLDSVNEDDPRCRFVIERWWRWCTVLVLRLAELVGINLKKTCWAAKEKSEWIGKGDKERKAPFSSLAKGVGR